MVLQYGEYQQTAVGENS